MNEPETTLEFAVDSLLEVLPSVWDRIRSNFRAAGTSKFGITLEQFHTLRHIYKGCCYTGDIAEKRQVSCSAVSQAVDVLVTKGLITRAQESGDRRQFRLELTPYARQVLDENYMENRVLIKQKMAQLSGEQRAIVVQSMEILKAVFISA